MTNARLPEAASADVMKIPFGPATPAPHAPPMPTPLHPSFRTRTPRQEDAPPPKMKTAIPRHSPRAGSFFASRTLGGLALAVAIAFPAYLSAENTPDAEDKPYSVFVGTDLAVHDALGRNPVIGAEKHTLIVRQKGAPKKVPIDGIKGLQFERGVKLSTLSAEVSDLKVSFSNQAAAQAWFEATSVQIALQNRAVESRDRALGEFARASNVGIPVGDDPMGVKQAARDHIASATAHAETEMLAGMNDATTRDTIANMHGERYRESAGQAGADTVNVSFKLSSPQPLGPGYVALITEYRVGGKDGVIEHGISVDQFDGLDAEPQRFRMRQNASSGQWELLNQRIVVFAEGQEVATNLSERRMNVTKDEAHQFIVRRYVLGSRGQTRGPAPIVMVPRPQLQAAARQADLPEAIFVKVDKDGAVLSLSTDRFGIAKVPPAGEVFLENIRFLPALDNGAPTEGTVKFTPADILR